MSTTKKFTIETNLPEVEKDMKALVKQIATAQETANAIMSKGILPSLDKINFALMKIAPNIENINALNQAAYQKAMLRLQIEQDQAEENKKTKDAIKNKSNTETAANKKSLEELQKIHKAKTEALAKEKNDYENFIKEISPIATVKDGVGIIDEKKTRENLETVGKAHEEYRKKIESTTNATTQYYDKAIEKAKAEGKDFSELQKKKGEDLEGLDVKFQTVNKAITDNTKQQTDLMVNTWKSAMDNVAKIAEGVMQGVNSIFGVMNQNFKIEIEAAKQDLAEATKEIENANKEKAAYNGEIESLKNSQYQLENELASNRANYTEEERQRREKDLQDSKDKLNEKLSGQKAYIDERDAIIKAAEEKKKNAEEKQKRVEARQKKAEVAQQIIKATADVASGVAKALSYGPILGPVLAAVVGAAGAVQVGIIASQYNRIKMAEGGLLNGKRHSEGGMRIEGTNIEVEGGEYVVNRRSTSKNLGLISYINSQDKELQAGDLGKFFAQRPVFMPAAMRSTMEEGGQIPQMDMPNSIDSDILDAIKSINLQPRVAVTDIIRAQDQYASVENWSGV